MLVPNSRFLPSMALGRASFVHSAARAKNIHRLWNRIYGKKETTFISA